MAALDIAREIAQLRATPGANWLAQALQKIADHINTPAAAAPTPSAAPPVTLESLLPPGTTLLTAAPAVPGQPNGATGTLLAVPVSNGGPVVDLSNPDNQGSAPVSIGLTMPADFIVTGSPAQNHQTIAVTRATETANTVLAGPASGSAAVPAYRALVAADIPAPAGDVTGTYAATTVTDTHLTNPLPVAQGGSGTATPALVAGTNITLSGAWPDTTVATVTDPTFSGGLTAGNDVIVNPGSFKCTPASGGSSLLVFVTGGTDIIGTQTWMDPVADVYYMYQGPVLVAGQLFGGSEVGDVGIGSSQGRLVLLSGTAGHPSLILDGSNNAIFASLLIPSVTAPPTTTPEIGQMVVDITNDKLWVYCTAGWKGVALS